MLIIRRSLPAPAVVEKVVEVVEKVVEVKPPTMLDKMKKWFGRGERNGD